MLGFEWVDLIPDSSPYVGLFVVYQSLYIMKSSNQTPTPLVDMPAQAVPINSGISVAGFAPAFPRPPKPQRIYNHSQHKNTHT